MADDEKVLHATKDGLRLVETSEGLFFMDDSGYSLPIRGDGNAMLRSVLAHLRAVEAERDRLREALRELLGKSATASDVRLLAVGLGGSATKPEVHQLCDRMQAAQDAARALLREASDG